MKTLLTLTLITTLFAVEAFANAGPGPWAGGAYYPGGTDGKYQAAVYGNNVSGIIGFTVREGSPAVTAVSSSGGGAAAGGGAAGGGGGASGGPGALAASNAVQAFDPTQNYFLIFVDGRTYSGLAAGSVNPVGKTVTGALLGTQPEFRFVTNSLTPELPPTEFLTNVTVTNIGTNPVISISNLPGITVTNVTNTTISITNGLGIVTTTNIFYSNVVTTAPFVITNTNFVPILRTNTEVSAILRAVSSSNLTTNAIDFLPILNRGLSGAFQAKLKDNKAYMTFKGDGQLSTPSQLQTVSLSTNATGSSTSGTIETDSIHFKVDGLRTSFSTISPTTTTPGAAAP